MGLDCGCVWMCVSECQCAFSRIMGIVTFRVKLCIYNSFHFCHLYQYHHRPPCRWLSVSMLLIWCTHANQRNARSQLIFRFCWMSMPSIPMDLNNLSSKLFYFVSMAVVVVGFPRNSGYWVGKNFYSAINCDSGTFRSNLMPFGWILFENLMMNL